MLFLVGAHLVLLPRHAPRGAVGGGGLGPAAGGVREPVAAAAAGLRGAHGRGGGAAGGGGRGGQHP
nr:hypothetical protein [Tanacetum cinerariifolium]